MKLTVEKKEATLLTVAVLILLLIAVVSQFVVLGPIKEEEKASLATLRTSERLYKKALENKKSDDKSTDSFTIQQKIPVKPQTQQVIEELTQSQDNSDSRIQSITVQSEVQKENEEGTPTPELKDLAFAITLETEDIKSLKSFIDQIETGTRLMRVSSITFSSPEQLKEKPLNVSLNVNAYYVPSFTTLEAQMPKLNVPAPSNKLDPFQ